MTLLLPRLSKAGVAEILGRHAPNPPPPKDLAGANTEYGELITYAASGGVKAPQVAFAIGAELRKFVRKHDANSQVARAVFDRDAVVFLATHDALQTGEALRNDVWAFITTVVAPDVVHWRFPDTKPERYHGGIRNAFQRLWLRGNALDRGESHPDRWELVRSIPEDAAVQILERPSVGGRPRLALAMGEGWLEMRKRIPSGQQEDVMRRASKIIRLQNQILDLQFLSDDQLSALVTEAFTKAGATL